MAYYSIVGSAVDFHPDSLRLITSNDLWDGKLFSLDAWEATELRGAVRLPDGLAGTPAIALLGVTKCTAGSFSFEFDYRIVAPGDSLDQPTVQEALADTLAAPASQLVLASLSLPAKAANWVSSGGKVLEWKLRRRGDDTAAAAFGLLDLGVSY